MSWFDCVKRRVTGEFADGEFARAVWVRNVAVVLFAKECDCQCAILRGDRVESSGDFNVDSGLRKGVFWFANDRSGLVFESEMWKGLIVVCANNATDS